MLRPALVPQMRRAAHLQPRLDCGECRVVNDAQVGRLARGPIRPAVRAADAGFALGAVTALIGPEAAMACTAAVETEIDEHYSRQLELLYASEEDPELAARIEEFRRMPLARVRTIRSRA